MAFSSTDTVASSMPRSSTAPAPVRARRTSAAAMPMAAYRPLTMSAMEVPTRTRWPCGPCRPAPSGGQPGSGSAAAGTSSAAAAGSGSAAVAAAGASVPVIDISPESAWMIMS